MKLYPVLIKRLHESTKTRMQSKCIYTTRSGDFKNMSLRRIDTAGARLERYALRGPREAEG